MMLLFLNNIDGEICFMLGYLLILFVLFVVLPIWLVIEIIRWLRRH